MLAVVSYSKPLKVNLYSSQNCQGIKLQQIRNLRIKEKFFLLKSSSLYALITSWYLLVSKQKSIQCTACQCKLEERQWKFGFSWKKLSDSVSSIQRSSFHEDRAGSSMSCFKIGFMCSYPQKSLHPFFFHFWLLRCHEHRIRTSSLITYLFYFFPWAR